MHPLVPTHWPIAHGQTMDVSLVSFLLQTAFLEDNESDRWSCLTTDDVESLAEKGGGVKVRTEEKVTVRCQEVVDVKFKSEEKVKVNVKRVVLEDKEAQLDKYIAALQRNNARLLQRFHVGLNTFPETIYKRKQYK